MSQDGVDPVGSGRCGCASDQCACVITGGTGVDVSGSGTKTNPYVLDADLATPNLSVEDEDTLIRSGITVLNFRGGGVTATMGAADEVIVTVPAPPAPPVVLALASGTATIPAPGALNTPVSVAVTFPVGRFAAAPIVTATINSATPQQRSPLGTSAISTTGFTVWVAQLSGTLAATTVHWHAMQAG